MNKVDIQNICTAPPTEWLAIHKETGVVIGVDDLDLGVRVASGRTTDGVFYSWPFFRCHICAFTGCCDREGKKVYDGQLFSDDDEHIFVVYWHAEHMQWLARQLDFDCSEELSKWPSSEILIIGHIHQPSEWAGEVKELLE